MGKELIPRALKQLSLPALAAMELACSATGVPRPGQVSSSSNPDLNPSKAAAAKVLNPQGFLSFPFPDELKHQIQVRAGWYYDGGDLHEAVDYILGDVDNQKSWKTFPVLAPADGEACVNPPHSEGDAVFIKHIHNGKTYYSYEGHVVEIDPKIPQCSTHTTIPVRQGQKVAMAGASGTFATHLHSLTKVVVDGQDIPISAYGLKTKRDQYPDPALTNGKACAPGALLIECPIDEKLANKSPKPSLIPELTATPNKSNLQKGNLVEVYDVNPGCLYVMKAPSAYSETIFCLHDYASATLGEGPILADDYSWWKLTQYGGWAVESKLKTSTNLTVNSKLAGVLPPAPVPARGSDTPNQAIEGFIKAAVSKDLTQARSFFSVDKQPKNWVEIFVTDASIIDLNKLPEPLLTNLAGCKNIPYETLLRDALNSSKSATLVYKGNCVTGWDFGWKSHFGRVPVPPLAHTNMLTVPLEQVSGRWYITPTVFTGNGVASLGRPK